jgi:hypothetical protein
MWFTRSFTVVRNRVTVASDLSAKFDPRAFSLDASWRVGSGKVVASKPVVGTQPPPNKLPIVNGPTPGIKGNPPLDAAVAATTETKVTKEVAPKTTVVPKGKSGRTVNVSVPVKPTRKNRPDEILAFQKAFCIATNDPAKLDAGIRAAQVILKRLKLLGPTRVDGINGKYTQAGTAKMLAKGGRVADALKNAVDLAISKVSDASAEAQKPVKTATPVKGTSTTTGAEQEFTGTDVIVSDPKRIYQTVEGVLRGMGFPDITVTRFHAISRQALESKNADIKTKMETHVKEIVLDLDGLVRAETETQDTIRLDVAAKINTSYEELLRLLKAQRALKF